MVQANAAWNRRHYYQEDSNLYVTMYSNSEVTFEIGGHSVHILQRQDYLNGSMMTSSVNSAKQTVNDISSAYANRPDFQAVNMSEMYVLVK